MPMSWPAELRERLYNAAINNQGSVDNPVKITVKYPGEDVTVMDVGGTLRKVPIPPCSMVLTKDEIVPVLVQDEVQHRQPEPDTSSTTVAIEPATGLPSHAIFPGYQGGGSGHINDYVHANGGFAFPDQALANPTCQACSDFNVLCANNEGFPCRRCDVHNMPCVVTFPPRSQQAYVAHILQGMDESRNIIRTGDDLGVAQALNAGEDAYVHMDF